MAHEIPVIYGGVKLLFVANMGNNGSTELGLERLRLYVMKLQDVLDAEAGPSRTSAPAPARDDSAVWS